jgi:ADP-heptose:LPS heptosyltransferase
MIRTFVQGAGGARVVIVGRGELLGGLPVGVEDWSNRTDLGELIGLLRKASYVVSSDSGPMHLAAALRPDRTLAVHFWSDPLRVGPFPRTAHVWKNGRLAPVSQLDEAWRPEGRAPTGQEMEDLGRFALDRLNAREGSVDGLG